MTYHPARVLQKISPTDKSVKSSDKSVQATLEMWDGNMFTFLVDEKIAKDVKDGDVVLVDYRPPKGSRIPVGNQKVIKVLKGKLGLEIWRKYKSFHSRRKKKPAAVTAPPTYMG